VNSRNDRLLVGYISIRTVTPGSSSKAEGEETFAPEFLAELRWLFRHLPRQRVGWHLKLTAVFGRLLTSRSRVKERTKPLPSVWMVIINITQIHRRVFVCVCVCLFVYRFPAHLYELTHTTYKCWYSDNENRTRKFFVRVFFFLFSAHYLCLTSAASHCRFFFFLFPFFHIHLNNYSWGYVLGVSKVFSPSISCTYLNMQLVESLIGFCFTLR